MLRRVKGKRSAVVLDEKSKRISAKLKSHAHQSKEQIVFGGSEEVLEKLEQKQKRKRLENSLENVEYVEQAWQDEDDQVSQLRSTATQGVPDWAKLDKHSSDRKDDSDSDSDELLRSTGNYLSSAECLPSGVIQMQKCCDINKDQQSKGKMKCVEFHPTAQVALTGGTDCTLSLFQVDGRHNPKIQSIFVERYPIFSAHFSPDGNHAYLGSKSKALYTYDLIEGRMTLSPIRGMSEDHKNTKQFIVSPDGRYLAVLGPDGNIHLVSAKSKEWISCLKMNEGVQAVTFNSDGTKLFSSGDGGDVYVWDMTSRCCVHRFTDDGCIQGTSLSVSPHDRFIATGSNSGVVNIYDYSTVLLNKKPQPLKAVMNLSTACTSLAFNSTAEILATASDSLDGAVKFVHVPSHTVFSNFPAFGERIYLPQSLGFSVNSGYFTIGNNKGQALLYSLVCSGVSCGCVRNIMQHYMGRVSRLSTLLQF